MLLLPFKYQRDELGDHLLIHFGGKKTGKISIVFEDLSINSIFLRTQVKA